MRSEKKGNLLLINGFGSPTTIINDLLSKSTSDSNIYLSYPLGVLTLAGWCRQEFPNFNIKIIDAMMDLHKHASNPDRDPLDINDFIVNMLGKIDFIPDFIGISMSFSNGNKTCLQVCRVCKEMWPDSRVIVGGVHATCFTRSLIMDPNIDYIIRGPGDIAIIDLLGCLLENQTPNHIPGVVGGVDNITSMALPLEDLNMIPPYPYDLLDMEYLVVNESTNPVYEAGTRTGIIFMSRGCPFRCTFCAAGKVHGRKTRFKSVDRMVSEVEYLIKEYRVNAINIIDDLFGADKEYFNEFFRKIKIRGLKFRLAIPGGLSIAIFNEEMIDVLVEHGLFAVYFPLESGSKYVQENIIKKRVDLDKAVRLINHTKKKGLFTGINIVLGSPGETRALMSETYEFIRTLPVDWIAFFTAYPYPETEMTNTLLKKGTVTECDLIEIWDTTTQGFRQRPFDTEEISGQELADLIYDFNIKLNFFFNYNLRAKNFYGILTKYNKIILRYPFHVIALACRAKCYYAIGRHDEAHNDIARIKDLIKENNQSRSLFERYEKLIRETIDFHSLSIDHLGEA